MTALHHTDLKTLNDTFLFSTKLITTFISKSTKQKIKSQEYSYSECDSALQVSLNQTNNSALTDIYSANLEQLLLLIHLECLLGKDNHN